MNEKNRLYKYEILQLNIRGARANKENLKHYISEMNYPEIVCLNETKLPTNIGFEIEGYNCAARRETNPNGGARGSMILTREDIRNVIEIEEAKIRFKADEVIGIKILGNNKEPPLNVFNYYNPPLCSTNSAVFNYLGTLKECTILTGDLNCKNKIPGLW